MNSERLKEGFLKLCEALNKEGVKYVVIGGFAVFLHGFPRFTEDIDLFIDPSPENILKLKKALSSIYDDPSIDQLAVEDFHQYAVIRYGTPDNFYVDFIAKIGEMFTFDDISKDIEKIKLENIEIPISGVKTLIEMKKTMREKDKQDLVFLYRKLRNQSEKN